LSGENALLVTKIKVLLQRKFDDPQEAEQEVGWQRHVFWVSPIVRTFLDEETSITNPTKHSCLAM